jgi:hypothetical protein
VRQGEKTRPSSRQPRDAVGMRRHLEDFTISLLQSRARAVGLIAVAPVSRRRTFDLSCSRGASPVFLRGTLAVLGVQRPSRLHTWLRAVYRHCDAFPRGEAASPLSGTRPTPVTASVATHVARTGPHEAFARERQLHDNRVARCSAFFNPSTPVQRPDALHSLGSARRAFRRSPAPEARQQDQCELRPANE